MPNKRYYYVTKAIDVYDDISYMSEILSVEIVDDGGVVFPLIERYKIKKKDTSKKSIAFKRKLRIKPSFLQGAPNKDKTVKQNTQVLGFIEDGNSVFTEKIKDQAGAAKHLFKIRIISNKTKRKIDLNVRFVKNAAEINKKVSKRSKKILQWTIPTPTDAEQVASSEKLLDEFFKEVADAKKKAAAAAAAAAAAQLAAKLATAKTLEAKALVKLKAAVSEGMSKIAKGADKALSSIMKTVNRITCASDCKLKDNSPYTVGDNPLKAQKCYYDCYLKKLKK